MGHFENEVVFSRFLNSIFKKNDRFHVQKTKEKTDTFFGYEIFTIYRQFFTCYAGSGLNEAWQSHLTLRHTYPNSRNNLSQKESVRIRKKEKQKRNPCFERTLRRGEWKEEWYHQESNRGHTDFQSVALPTELWHHLVFFSGCKGTTFSWTPKTFAQKLPLFNVL